MSAVKQLYQLQEIEQQIDALEKQIRDIEAQLSGNDSLVKARNNIASLQQEIEELKKAQRENQTETADVNAKIAAVEKELFGGKNVNPKELVNLQIEIDGLKTRLSEFESKAIVIIEQLDKANTALAGAEANLVRLESEWQGSQIELAKQAGESRALLAELTRQRDELAAAIPADAVSSYYFVKKQKGKAVAIIEQGICCGCRIQLPARQIQQARGNRIVQCSSCGRLLYMP